MKYKQTITTERGNERLNEGDGGWNTNYRTRVNRHNERYGREGPPARRKPVGVEAKNGGFEITRSIGGRLWGKGGGGEG